MTRRICPLEGPRPTEIRAVLRRSRFVRSLQHQRKKWTLWSGASSKGKTRAEAARLFDQFHKLVTGQSQANGNRADLGKLAVFSGVCEFPVRVKCATLAWHTLQASLEGKHDTVST